VDDRVAGAAEAGRRLLGATRRFFVPLALPDPKPRLASECDVELMAEGEILEHQVAPATKRHQHGAQQEKRPSGHPPEYQRVPVTWRSPYSDRLLPPYNPSTCLPGSQRCHVLTSLSGSSTGSYSTSETGDPPSSFCSSISPAAVSPIEGSPAGSRPMVIVSCVTSGWGRVFR
jgi:hypothetical protein